MSDGLLATIDLPDFRRQLAEVSRVMQRRAIGQGVRDAARVLRDATRAHAPVLREATPGRVPGTLQRAIAVARTRNTPRGVISYSVVVRAATKARRGGARDPFYWRFLEGGWIPRGPGRRLRGGALSKGAQRRQLAAGRRQFPFLDPAFRAAGGSAVAAFNSAVESRLAEVEAIK